MKIFYFTFGYKHIHPETGRRLRDGWYQVKAKDSVEAREKIVSIFGQAWSMQYEEKQFGEETRALFTEGCLKHFDLIEEGSFESYLINSKAEFVKKVNDQKWNPELRVVAEDFIIAFDQLKDKFLQVNEAKIRNEFLKLMLDSNSISKENYNYYYETIKS